MEEIREYFGDLCEVIPEGIARATSPSTATHQDIVAMVSRRPMTAADISVSLNLPIVEVRRQLALLEGSQSVRLDFYDGEWYYRSTDRASELSYSVHCSTGGIS
jgi:hypothetical protein